MGKKQAAKEAEQKNEGSAVDVKWTRHPKGWNMTNMDSVRGRHRIAV